MQQQQCAGAVLMIRPARFDYNAETAATNGMQRPRESSLENAAELARREFAALAASLRSEGIEVCVAEDTPEPAKPDAVFSNNWLSFHPDGTLVLYPMQSESRRRERRLEIAAQVSAELGFVVRRTLDLTHHEHDGHFLEGTGSLVLDHVGRVAYACRSPRTHAEPLAQWCRVMGYEPVMFDARDRHGLPVYHTNVMMCIGARAIVIGAAAIAAGDRARVLQRLAAGGREIIEISHEAIEGFAGNMLELATWDEALGDSTVLVMSAHAREALGPEAFTRLSACTDAVLAVPVPTIERLGGGSVRCMLTEVFLPP
ncbi:MAG TPA: arginine deiminase-related protein [Steroidobacteraceae bacterium]|nr:arginine deiminase-related protein [Steroidobacteraceae bacterium]